MYKQAKEKYLRSVGTTTRYKLQPAADRASCRELTDDKTLISSLSYFSSLSWREVFLHSYFFFPSDNVQHELHCQSLIYILRKQKKTKGSEQKKAALRSSGFKLATKLA